MSEGAEQAAASFRGGDKPVRGQPELGGQGWICGAELHGLCSDLPRQRDISLLLRDALLGEGVASCNHSEDKQHRQDGDGASSPEAVPADAGTQEVAGRRGELNAIGDQVAGLKVGAGVSHRGSELAAFPQPGRWAILVVPFGGGLLNRPAGPQRRHVPLDRLSQR